MNKGVIRLVPLSVLVLILGATSLAQAVPLCLISGTGPTCATATNIYTATVVPGATYVWSLLNNSAGAIIVAGATTASVQVGAGAAGGSFDLQLAVAVGGVTNTCSQPVTVMARIQSQFVGVMSANSVLPPLDQQLTNPVQVLVYDNQPISFLKGVLSNVPSGYVVTNGTYVSWCVEYFKEIEAGVAYRPIMYLSHDVLPPHLQNPNWDLVNYILNHKQGNGYDIQTAIWAFVGGPAPPLDPVFGTPGPAALAMILDATVNGNGFIPTGGEVSAVILDLGPNLQMNIIEVQCPGELAVCVGSDTSFCTATTGPGPISYRWLKDGILLPGQQNSCLQLFNVSASDAGLYCVEVTGPCNSITNCARLTITNGVLTALGPTNFLGCAGGTATFCTTPIGGGPFTYTWTHNDELIVGATNSCLSLSNLSLLHKGKYCVKIVGACSSTTNCATLDLLMPGLVLRKICPNPTAPGGLLIFSGSVSNSGAVTLTDIQIWNDQPAPLTPVTNFTTLAPGAVATFSGSYNVPADYCGSILTDTLVAHATSVCGAGVMASDTKDCPIVNHPRLVVTKVCPAPAAPGGLLIFSGSVSNAGDVTLTNVQVFNDQPIANTAVTNFTILAPGATAIFSGSYTVPADYCGSTLTDTLTARATSLCGANVTAMDTKDCPIVNHPRLVVTKVCPAPVAPGGLLIFSGSVSNAGDVTLTNVQVFNDQPIANTAVTNFTILAPGATAIFSGRYTVPADYCGSTLTDTLTARATSLCGTNVTAVDTKDCPIVNHPRLVVTKVCPAPVAPGGLLIFSGSVSNAGDVTLTNVQVFNDQPVANTAVTNFTTLAPGATAIFSGSYTVPADYCGSTLTDTLTARATSLCGANVTAMDTKDCPIVNHPRLVVTKVCPAPVAPGGLLIFSGSVSNAGDVTLTNVQVFNDQPVANTAVTNFTILAPGATAIFTGGYTVPADYCGATLTDTLTARATSLCGTNVTAMDTKDCPIVNHPRLVVTKVCPAPVAPGGLLIFSGSVSNAGDVTLTNVQVFNDQPVANTAVTNFTTLAPGATAIFSGRYTVPADYCGSTLTDTLTARATSLCGANVTAMDTKDCPIVNHPRLVVTKVCPAPVAPGGLLIFSGSVSNAGDVTLTNVQVFNDQPIANTAVTNFTILAPGATAIFSGSYTVPADYCGATLTDTLTARATSLCGTNVTAMDTKDCPIVNHPRLVVTKVCPAPVAPGGLLIFSGSVSNAGDVTLTNVQVFNDQPIANTAVTNFTTLAPGATAIFSGSYTVPADYCGSTLTDTLTARATSLCGANVTAMDTKDCPIVNHPRLVVTKVCPAPVAPGGLLIFSGSVSNAGDVTLTNVQVFNDQPIANTAVTNFTILAPGATAIFSGSYTVPADYCGATLTDTLTARATSLCGTNVTATDTKDCPIVNHPRLVVTKACPAPVAPGGLLIFSGSVSNAGDVTLTNVQVFNDQPIANTAVTNFTTLAPGATAIFSGSYTVPADYCGSTLTDTLTARATSLCGTNVTAMDTKDCPIVNHPRLVVTKVCPAPVAPGGLLIFSGSVSNAGDVTLTNVQVFNDQPIANTAVTNFTILAPGATAIFSGSYTVPADYCGATLTDTLTARATSLCGTNVTAMDTKDCPIVNHPRLVVTKVCPAPVAPGGLLIFSGSVSNAGDVTLTNVQVFNDQPVANTAVTNFTILAPGATAIFTGGYTVPADYCGATLTDTLTARATSLCGTNVTAMDTKDCPIVNHPRLVVTKVCPAPVAPGGLLIFSGSVSNAGDVTLTNVQVFNDQPIANTAVTNFTILAPGATAIFSGRYTVPADYCGSTLTDTLTARATSLCGTNVTAVDTKDCPIVNHPRLVVTKVCPAPVAPGGLLIFSGSVSNAGDVTLTNVQVFNDQPVANTAVTNFTTLAPGATAIFSGSYTVPADYCGSTLTDTLTARATSLCGANVTAMDTKDCPIVNHPRLVVTKVCPAPVAPGGLLIFSGSVSNAGDVTLTNVQVFNDQPVANTAVTNFTILAPGATAIFTGGYTVPADYCGATLTDTLTARATSLCGTNVTAMDTKDCPIVNHPRLVVTKVCPAPVAPGGLLIFSGSVSNAGDVTLTNVQVFNDQPIANTAVTNFTTLAPGATAIFSGRYTVPADYCGSTLTDTLTARATSLCGTNVTATDTKDCPIVNHPRLVVTKVCPAPVAPGGLLIFSGSVSNAGDVTLTNVQVFNDQPIANTAVTNFTILAPGATAIFSGSYIVPADYCGSTLTDTLTARATSVCGTNVTAMDTKDCPIVNHPRLVVTKMCPAPVAPGGLLIFSGSVSNAGDVTLTNVQVFNDQPIANTAVTNFTILAPGATAIFTGGYTVPADYCGATLTDTLTARATSLCGTNVTAMDTKDCPIVNHPRLVVTKVCPAPVAPGGLLIFSGSVSNAGDVTLTNVQVFNDQPIANTAVTNFTTLAPGATAIFSGRYTVPADYCGSTLTDTLTARATSLCGTNVTATDTKDCPIVNHPRLVVTKVCPAPVAPGGLLIFSGSVSNAGDVTLTNVQVFNDQPVANTAVTNFTTLAPGATAIFSGGYIVPANYCGATLTDTLTARATSICGTGVTATETKDCPIVNPGIMVIASPLCLARGDSLRICPIIKIGNGTMDYPYPVSCAWTKNGLPVSNVSNCCLVITSYSASDVGTYSLTVTGLCGVTASTNITLNELMVGSNFAIVLSTNAPRPGDTLSFCTLDLPNFSYMWFKNGSLLAGQTSHCLTLSNVTSTDEGQYCVRATDLRGCESVTNCTTLRLTNCEPGFKLEKTAAKTTVSPGGLATYYYTITNTGCLTLTNLLVRDDNGTPGFVGDDFVAGTISLLPIGASITFTQTVIVPIRLCADSTGQESGTVITKILPNGNIQITFIQATNVNDNTYGTNAMGWGGANGHKFRDLTGSDEAELEFKNGAGSVVLHFKEDYITASANFPSGYGSLGVIGGDGKMVVGSAASILAVSSSLQENLNKPPFLNNLAKYTVDSPALNDPNSGQWEYRMIYTVVVDKNAFGSSGFGSVSVVDQHNSPAKISRFVPVPCDRCITNLAVATAYASTNLLIAQDDAMVCVCTNQNDCTPPPPTPGVTNRCAEDYSFWKKNPKQWPASYTPNQKLGTVFSKAAPDAAGKTLQEAIDGKAGSPKVKELLKQAVTALLNAASPSITYAYTVQDVVNGVNMALMNGKDQALKTLTELLKAANDEKNCHPALNPCIAVVKEIACLLPGDQCGTFGKIASGYKGQNDAGFCYRITVTNCGPVALTDLSLIDNKLGDLTSQFFASAAAELAPGQSVTKYFKMAWATHTTNTVTVQGRAVGTGGQLINNQDSAVALVETAGLTCAVVLESSGDLDGRAGDNHVRLGSNGAPSQVTFRVVTCNSGGGALSGVQVSSPQLVGLGCAPIAPFNLAAGACVTNLLCAHAFACATLPFNSDITVTANVNASGSGACGYDLNGQIARVATSCSGVVECNLEQNPGLMLVKSANKTTAAPGGAVTYTYTVKNIGQTTLTNIEVSDDNGTPDFAGDDFIVGVIPSLAPGASMDLSRTVTLPITLCAAETGAETGTLISEVLSNGNIRVIFIQSASVNDNTYGTNSIGWGGVNGHKFRDLTGSDKAEFQFKNGAGQVVLEFQEDYITASPNFPSGYGTLGVTGGDGAMVTGSAASVVAFSTSLTENLNKAPFLSQLAKYTVDSPALNDPNSSLWEYRMIYTVVIAKNAFGSSGFGSVALTDQHNSPGKTAKFTPVVCDRCVTNVAVAIAHSSTNLLVVQDDAVVCVCTNNTGGDCGAPSQTTRCPETSQFWTKNVSQWAAGYSGSQKVGSVFIKTPADAANKTLLVALDGKAGSPQAKELLKQAVTALLNASTPAIRYDYTVADIISAVNAAFTNGGPQSLTSLTQLLKAANEETNCGAHP